ncbi:hypothetical protein ACLI4Y_02595 [Natrialbaceae archaeon A-CW3]
MTPRRRDVLELAGATATVATIGIAGCATRATGKTDDNDELPAYTSWLTLDDDGLEFIYANWEILEELVADDLEEQGPGEAEVPAEFEADPMIAPVSDALVWAYFFVALDLARFRLGRLLDEDEFESSIEELVLANEVLVLTGTVDPGEIDARLTPEAEAGFIVQVEQTDEIDEYDVYTAVDDDTDAAVAVSTEALVFAGGEDLEEDDLSTILETTIGASAGTVDRATDESDSVAWLVESAGDGDIVVGQYGDRVGDEGVVDLAFEELEDADGIVSSVTVEDEETLTGDFAAIIDDPDEATLEELLGISATERSVDVDEDHVIATATWRDEGLTADRLRYTPAFVSRDR